eukprot:4499362-Amphidinium_carterae.1
MEEINQQEVMSEFNPHLAFGSMGKYIAQCSRLLYGHGTHSSDCVELALRRTCRLRSRAVWHAFVSWSECLVASQSWSRPLLEVYVDTIQHCYLCGMDGGRATVEGLASGISDSGNFPGKQPNEYACLQTSPPRRTRDGFLRMLFYW